MWRLLVGIVLGLIAGFIVGFLIGNQAACRAGCNFDPTLFGSVGTWVSGLGTTVTAGVVGWIAWLQYHQPERRHATAVANTARICKLACNPGKSNNQGPFDRIYFSFTNDVARDINNASVFFNDREIGTAQLVAVQARPWTTVFSFSEAGLETFADELSARQAIKANVMPRVRFEFTIGDHRFSRLGSEVRKLESHLDISSQF